MSQKADVSLTGKIAIVTGGSSGIGKEIARNLASCGATVVLACRDSGRAEAARRELLLDDASRSIECMTVDVSSLDSIASFASEVSERFGAVHVLVNNAGAWFGTRRESVDGIELTLATNAVGPWVLTRALAGVLEKGRARVINIGSHLAGSLDLDDLQIERKRYRGFAGAYQASKEAFLLLSRALDAELSPRGITVNVAEPGWVRTESHRHAFFLQRLVMNLAGTIAARRPAEGADTPTWMAVAPELEGVSGRRYQDRAEIPLVAGNSTPDELISRLEALIARRGTRAADARVSPPKAVSPVVAVLLAALVVVPALAESKEGDVVQSGVSFERTTALDGAEWTLQGAGTSVVSLFVTELEIYAIGHYRNGDRSAFRVVALRKMKKSHIDGALDEAAAKDMAVNAGALRELKRCVSDSPKGETTWYYDDGEALRYQQGTRACSPITDPALREAVFGMWISEKDASDPSLRKKLLGKN